jgi:hypothetical protein
MAGQRRSDLGTKWLSPALGNDDSRARTSQCYCQRAQVNGSIVHANRGVRKHDPAFGNLFEREVCKSIIPAPVTAKFHFRMITLLDAILLVMRCESSCEMQTQTANSDRCMNISGHQRAVLEMKEALSLRLPSFIVAPSAFWATQLTLRMRSRKLCWPRTDISTNSGRSRR